MRRLLCLFLLMWFPLQMSWAAVASYCQHETDPAAQRHLGHHEHVHHADPQSGERHGGVDAKHKSGVDKKAGIDNDNDCAVCHLNMATPVSQVSPFDAEADSEWSSGPAGAYASNIPKGPERPDIQPIA